MKPISPPFTPTKLGKGVTTERVLLYLKAFHLAHDRLPTKLQIAKHFGFCSPNASYFHLKQLAKQKKLVKDGKSWRFTKPSDTL